MIYGPLNGEMAMFTYDCRNRLTQVTTDSGETTQYAYDAENVRTKVIKNASTQKETVTTYVTDSVSHELSRVLEATTTDKTGNTETIRYTYGNGLVAQEKGKEYLLYHFNHLGSTTAVTDASGEIRYTYTYNIFGKLLRGNYGEVEFLYNGQYGVASDANGLYYMRARYYNIDIMRFINQDILTGSIDSTQSLNRYAYVEGNPVNFLDPFGLCPDVFDTSILHQILGEIGWRAFGVSVTTNVMSVTLAAAIAKEAVSGSIAIGIMIKLQEVSAIATKISITVSVLNAGVYVYDAYKTEDSFERYDSITNASLSMATIVSGSYASVFSNYEVAYAIRCLLDLILNELSYSGVE